MTDWKLGDEFKCKKFGFCGVLREQFCFFLYNWPVPVYLCYRVVLMLYTLACLGHPVTLESRSWNFLTQWSYFALCVYLALHCLLAVYHHCSETLCQACRCCRRDRGQDIENGGHHRGITCRCSVPRSLKEHRDRVLHEETEATPPWYVCVVWTAFTTTSTVSLLVTLVYYAFHRQIARYNPDLSDFANVNRHAINSLIVIVENLLTAVPYRLLHFVYPLLFGIVYVLFSVVIWENDRRIIYEGFLDWRFPGTTVGFLVAAGVGIVIVHTLFFLLSKLRLYLYVNHCSCQNAVEPQRNG